MEHTFDIDFERCLCIHSLLQLVDVSLQTILYIRGVIPEPFSMIDSDPSPKMEQFRETYKKVIYTLKDVFRSHNRKVIDEVMISFGNTPFAPLDIFRIDVKPCRFHENATETKCTETCGVLSPRDRRKIFTSLATGDQAAPKLGKLVKVFVSLKTSGKLLHVIDGLDFDENYEPLEPTFLKRRGVRTVRIVPRKCDFNNEELTIIDMQSRPSEVWHQVTHIISSL